MTARTHKHSLLFSVTSITLFAVGILAITQVWSGTHSPLEAQLLSRIINDSPQVWNGSGWATLAGGYNNNHMETQEAGSVYWWQAGVTNNVDYVAYATWQPLGGTPRNAIFQSYIGPSINTVTVDMSKGPVGFVDGGATWQEIGRAKLNTPDAWNRYFYVQLTGAQGVSADAVRLIASKCGNAVCELGESSTNCASDCPASMIVPVSSASIASQAASSAPAARCGDGIIQNGEQCDDGNSVLRDGCSATCTIETYWTCNGSPSVCQKCGNGKKEGTEECDDGNSYNRDSCTNVCKLAACGDGFEQSGEQCDDGNQVDTDTCTNACKRAACGDGITQSSREQCDDGNQVNTDTCTNNCTLPICGDRIVQAGEQCDDGDKVDSNGCTNKCTLPVCGDSIKQNGEQCDAGTENNKICTAVYGQTCTYCGSDCKPAVAQGGKCGDGTVQSVEQCDDANTVAGDGCAATCTKMSCVSTCKLEAGWTCNGSPSVCQKCGNKIKEGTEECDDGNQVDTDTCSNACKISICGDGIVQSGEECDNGASNNQACTAGYGLTCNSCSTACKQTVVKGPYCGDQIVQAGEYCDLGKDNGYSSCSATCQKPLPGCSDGIDNDKDGKIDFCKPDGSNAATCDHGCTSSSDYEDVYPACSSPARTSTKQCVCDITNDCYSNYLFGNDKCNTTTNLCEVSECSDGIDNDGDGLTDAKDQGCIRGWGEIRSEKERNICYPQTNRSIYYDSRSWCYCATDADCGKAANRLMSDICVPVGTQGLKACQPVPACRDGQDNDDMDNAFDFCKPDGSNAKTCDPGCRSPDDNDEQWESCTQRSDCPGNKGGIDTEVCIVPSERSWEGKRCQPLNQCNDGVDNDGDGLIDAQDGACPLFKTLYSVDPVTRASIYLNPNNLEGITLPWQGNGSMNTPSRAIAGTCPTTGCISRITDSFAMYMYDANGNKANDNCAAVLKYWKSIAAPTLVCKADPTWRVLQSSGIGIGNFSSSLTRYCEFDWTNAGCTIRY